MARLQELYRKEIVPALQQELKRSCRMAVPRIEKICLNMGVGEAIANAKILEEAVKHLAAITGQAPQITKAKNSVSNFRLRENYKIGCRVTLRGRRMYEFLDRLVNAAIPRIRDFRGINPRGFDRQGNFSLGLEEIVIFPEIEVDRMETPLGMDVTFVIRNSAGAEESHRLLKLLGMPFSE